MRAVVDLEMCLSVAMCDLLYGVSKRARVLPGTRVLREESASLSPQLGLVNASKMNGKSLTPECYINKIDENWLNCFSIKFVKRQRQNRKELLHYYPSLCILVTFHAIKLLIFLKVAYTFESPNSSRCILEPLSLLPLLRPRYSHLSFKYWWFFFLPSHAYQMRNLIGWIYEGGGKARLLNARFLGFFS